MNTTKQRLLALLLIACGAITPTVAQNRTAFAGQRNAIAYSYGTGAAPGGQVVMPSPLVVDIGNAATGSQSITVAFGSVTAGDGTVFTPLNINAPIFVGGPTNQEKVTPSAVSCTTPTIYDTCTFTATFANTHGRGEQITSATFGLQEAINIQNALGGGQVAIDLSWQLAGGTAAIITAAAPFSNVVIEDNRATPATYWSMQPTTLTLLAAPTTLTATTVASGTATGTWTAADTFFCITYVDALGGEGPCSATYDFTLTASVAVNFTAAAAPASTGAVGWRAYAGSSYALAYLLPITSANCVLTTLETVIPACAIGVAAVFPTANTTTTQLKPAPATPLAAANNPVPQGHTTFAYEPSAGLPVPFQTHFGPFPAMSGGTTAGQVAVLGSMQLPAGYLNQIGRTVRVSGKMIVATAATTTTPSIILKLGWAGGDTAGAGIAVCTMTTTSALGVAATYNLPFSCTMTTNAVGATAIGSLQPDGWADFAVQGGTTAAVAIVDTGTAAIGSLGLFSQNTLYVYFTGATSTTSSLQLMDLHFETLL